MPVNQYIGVEASSPTKRGKLARLLPIGPVDETKLSQKKTAGFQTLNMVGVSIARRATAALLWEYVTSWVEDGKLKPTPFHVLKGMDVDVVDRTRDGCSNGMLNGQWQVRSISEMQEAIIA